MIVSLQQYLTFCEQNNQQLLSSEKQQELEEQIKILEEQHQSKELISVFLDIFSTSSTDIGTTDMAKHNNHINLLRKIEGK